VRLRITPLQPTIMSGLQRNSLIVLALGHLLYKQTGQVFFSLSESRCRLFVHLCLTEFGVIIKQIRSRQVVQIFSTFDKVICCSNCLCRRLF